MRRALALLAIGLILAACTRGVGGETPAPTPGRSVIAASQLPAGTLVTGVLGADSIEGGCPYLEADDGTRYQVIWPNGWTLDRSSAELSDPQGVIVARAGDRVSVRGEVAPEVATTCQIGPVFRASEVVVP